MMKKAKYPVTLESLVGLHLLSGVDMETKDLPSEYNDDSTYRGNVINFVLDGKTYTAMEDDNDGYRSAMRELFVSRKKVSNQFDSFQVMGIYRSNGEYGSKDSLLELYDVRNGKCVLVVGTHNTDGYYPSFVSTWNPENIFENEVKP